MELTSGRSRRSDAKFGIGTEKEARTIVDDFRQSRGLQDLLVTLSTLLRGSIYEKLRWTFKLYDINGDGCITRGELGEVVTAVHELMGKRHLAEEERKAREQLDRVFKKLDLNQDGVITIEEFIESCLKVRLAVKQSRVEVESIQGGPSVALLGHCKPLRDM